MKRTELQLGRLLDSIPARPKRTQSLSSCPHVRVEPRNTATMPKSQTRPVTLPACMPACSSPLFPHNPHAMYVCPLTQCYAKKTPYAKPPTRPVPKRPYTSAANIAPFQKQKLQKKQNFYKYHQKTSKSKPKIKRSVPMQCEGGIVRTVWLLSF